MMPFRALLLFAVALLSHPVIAQERELSSQTHALFERIRDNVAQIRVLLGTSDTHAATGSGFVVGNGLVITNYHVIANKALEPDTYRLEFVLPGGRRGPLEIRRTSTCSSPIFRTSRATNSTQPVMLLVRPYCSAMQIGRAHV